MYTSLCQPLAPATATHGTVCHSGGDVQGAHVEAAQDQGLREDWAAFLANLGNQYIETDSAPGTVPTAQRSANDTSQQVAPMPAARNEYMDKPTKAENAHQPR